MIAQLFVGPPWLIWILLFFSMTVVSIFVVALMILFLSLTRRSSRWPATIGRNILWISLTLAGTLTWLIEDSLSHGGWSLPRRLWDAAYRYGLGLP